ncbi:MAG: hypothetical protein WCJ50_05755, partial [Actinomycetes bacterium]
MQKRLPFTIILTLLAAAATPAAASASVASSRAGDPIIATGARVSALLGASPQRIVAYRYAAKRLQQVPLQVDERKLFDVGNAYLPASPSGEQTLVYADVE